MDKVYNQLLDAIKQIVSGRAPWREKQAALLQWMADNAGGEWGEFVDWLKDVDPDDV